MTFRLSSIAVALCVCLWAPLSAQAPAKGPAPGEVETDPIRCWWKTSVSAVQVGERFTLVVTCGVIETPQIRVVSSMDKFDPTALTLTPFEVVEGKRHEDILAFPWRYFQYEYTLRLLSERFFGQDIDIPAVNVTYRVESGRGGGEGREQTYVLPALPIRILSLVPGSATNIRDAAAETFEDIEAQDFRATEEIVAAGILFSFAVVFVGLAIVRLRGRRRGHVTAVARPLADGAVLRGCVRAANRLKSDAARDGWTPELAARALTIFRIAGAMAMERPVAQTLVEPNVPGRDGQLVLPRGILRRRRALVSAPTTAGAVDRRLTGANGMGVRTRAVLEGIQEPLRVFSAARYSSNGVPDRSELDAALEGGIGAMRRLRVMKSWPARTATAIAKSTSQFWGFGWSR